MQKMLTFKRIFKLQELEKMEEIVEREEPEELEGVVKIDGQRLVINFLQHFEPESLEPKSPGYIFVSQRVCEALKDFAKYDEIIIQLMPGWDQPHPLVMKTVKEYILEYIKYKQGIEADSHQDKLQVSAKLVNIDCSARTNDEVNGIVDTFIESLNNSFTEEGKSINIIRSDSFKDNNKLLFSLSSPVDYSNTNYRNYIQLTFCND